MDGSNSVNVKNSCGGDDTENGITGSDRRPPNPIISVNRHGLNSSGLPMGLTPCKKKSLVRHSSLVRTIKVDTPLLEGLNINDGFIPVLRSGAWTDIGSRSTMEDVYIRVDDFMLDYGSKCSNHKPNAFYGVFDGHGGKHAADFACHHLPRFLVKDNDFPREIERAVLSAFLQTDAAFSEACSLDADLDSGTTALAALVMGRSLLVANAGDCRAVLCRRGKAIEMSRDHKPVSIQEKTRIEASGGYVYDGYLNGQLNVARAIGDWHMEGLKNRGGDGGGGGGGPLSAEPELMSTNLTDEDEFLIIGCDGIWDVFRSQNAVDFARRRLQEHNDPVICSKDIVNEALKRKSGDNLSVVVVCFQSQPPPNIIVPRGRVHRSVSAEGLKELQSFLDKLECG